VYGAIKQADPGAVVLTPAPQGVNGYEWMNSYFAAGGQQSADVVSFHGYPGYDGEKKANPPEMWIHALLNMNSVMARYGVHKPLWDTEFSWEFNDSLPNETDRAAFVARMFVLHWLYGADRAYWHMWDGSTGTLWTGSTTQAGTAYEVITRWLAGASLDQCKTQDNGTWTCHLVRSDGLQSWILWNVNGAAQVQPDSAWAVQTRYELDGGSHAIDGTAPVAVSRLPVMVEGAPASTGPDFYVTVSPNSAVMSSSGSAEFKVTLTPVQGFAKQVTMSCSGAPAEQACTPSPSVVKLNGSTPVKVTYTVAPASGMAANRTSGWVTIPLAALGLILLPGARRRRGAKALAVVTFVSAASLLFFSCSAGGGRSQKGSALDASSGSYALTLAATSGKIDHGTYVTLDVQ
jgi:Glycosyl hydrolase catalytic core